MLPRLSLLLLALAACAAHAEKADRTKPLVFTSDQRGSVDGVNQRTELQGNVVITQGSLMLRAEKVDVRETRDGYIQAYANGATGKPVTFRQGQDKPGESIEGVADQLEYDTRTETIRFIGSATMRRMRGSTITNEVSGAVILYDSRSEVFTLEAGNTSPNPSGRTRIVIMPPAQPDDPASAPAPGLPLKPSTTLTPGKAS